MADYLEHTTTDGDRWDALAERYYGDAYAYVRLIDANPDVPIRPVLPAGVRLLVPIVDTPDVLDQELPPWKR